MRQVRRLHIRAPQDAAAQRGRWLIEDALRTASLGDAGRLLLIRRIQLPRLDPQASAASVALRVEQALRQAQQRALPAHAADAAQAPAVWFATPLQAHLQLLSQLLQGRLPRDWFWTRAVPAFVPAQTPAAAFVAVWAALLREPGGVVAAARWLRELAAQQHLQAVVARLDAGSAAQLAMQCRWSLDAEATTVEPPTPTPTPMLQAALQQLQAAPPSSVASRRFIVALLLVAERSARLGDPRVPAQAAALLQQASTVRSEQADRLATRQAPADVALGHAPMRAWRPELSVAIEASPVTSPTTREPAPVTLPFAPSAPPAAGIDGLRSEHAGLGFALNALARLGIEAWLQREPALAEAQFAQHLLLDLCAGHAVAEDDPLRAVFAAGIDAAPAALPPWSLPAAWLAGARPLLSPALAERLAARGDLRALLLAWRLVLQRYLRRSAGLGLRELLRRRGRVRSSDTHLDIELPLAELDLRVRRSGLDLDPGWLPWLGYIVGFHYEELAR